jgi:hypothetical protein
VSGRFVRLKGTYRDDYVTNIGPCVDRLVRLATGRQVNRQIRDALQLFASHLQALGSSVVLVWVPMEVVAFKC